MEVRWAPKLDMLELTLDDDEPREGAVTMPLFPVSRTQPFLPYESAQLVIHEPRYRAMYNDILLSGARRFMVCNMDPSTRRFAEVGVIFHLDEIKEVSERTQDRIKYVGQHSVIGRVKLVKVLNPSAGNTRETYMRAEVSKFEDADAEENTATEEIELRQLFDSLIDTQTKLGEVPRFMEVAKSNVTFSRGTGLDDMGLWGAMLVWNDFLKQREKFQEEKMWNQFQAEVDTFLKKKGYVLEDLLEARGDNALQGLPIQLKREINAMRSRYLEDFKVGDPTSAAQAMLQSTSHAERLSIFQHLLKRECKRLAALASLESMFKV
jgi:Lon protease-like protein